MALVIEDGTLIADANSYVTVEEARAFAEARALPLPEDDVEVEALLIRAMDYLESLASSYQGAVVSSSQSLQWPRTEIYLYGSREAEPLVSIPRLLKWAQIRLAIDIPKADVAASESGNVIMEKVDVIETQYGPGGKTAFVLTDSDAALYLAPLFGYQQRFALTSVRI